MLRSPFFEANITVLPNPGKVKTTTNTTGQYFYFSLEVLGLELGA
jgi:hypothetical protein